MTIAGIGIQISQMLEDIQTSLFQKAERFREQNMQQVDSYEEFKEKLKGEGGFFLAHWDGTSETEELIKQETQATIRCIPLDIPSGPGTCMVTGKPSAGRVVFAKAY
jgi:prolyl-tRNA synthetase